MVEIYCVDTSDAADRRGGGGGVTRSMALFRNCLFLTSRPSKRRVSFSGGAREVRLCFETSRSYGRRAQHVQTISTSDAVTAAIFDWTVNNRLR